MKTQLYKKPQVDYKLDYPRFSNSYTTLLDRTLVLRKINSPPADLEMFLSDLFNGFHFVTDASVTDASGDLVSQKKL